LRIVKNGLTYFVMDLKSRSGTFYKGTYLSSGVEHEVEEGVPIAIGMSVISIGGEPAEEIVPFLDSIELTRESGGQSGIFEVHRERTNQKKLELFYRASTTLSKNSPLDEILKEILDHICELLGRIDRGAFILMDPNTETITDVISKPYELTDESTTLYCGDVVRRVIEGRMPVVISNAQTLKEDELADTLKVLKIESVICLPLLSGSQIMGVMYFDSLRRLYGFSREDVQLFKDLSRRIVGAIEEMRFASDQTSIS
jgi:transcriptional regulator with GAF, ATPase, and Fis domain